MSNDLIKFGVVLSLADKFSGGISKARKNAAGFDKSVSGINKQIGELTKISKRGEAFRGLGKSFRQTSTDINNTKTKITSLQKELNKLGGAGARGFATRHREMVKLQNQLKNQQQRLRDNKRAIREETAALRDSGVEVRNLARDIKHLGEQKDKLRSKRAKLQNLGLAEDRLNQFNSKYGPGMRRAGVIGTAAVAGAGYAYMRREDAETDLRMAMLQKGGKLPSSFKSISRQSKTLGNQLPGSTADFYGAARALVEQGVSDKIIAEGGLKAASYLGVISGIDPALAATITAKSREAYGLSGKELITMADITQRKQAAFGITADDGLSATSNLAPTLNALKIGGVKNLRSLSAIEGIAAGTSLEGSEYGTAMARFLDNTAAAKGKLNSNALSEYKALLESKGISLDFYKDGKFGGIRNAVSELKELRDNLSEQDFANLTDKLFGDRGKKIATLLGDSGLKGLDDALTKMNQVASIEDKLNLKTGTLGSKLEALGGTFADTAADLFEPFSGWLKDGLDWANKKLGEFSGWLEKLSPQGRQFVSITGLMATGLGALFAMNVGKSLLIRGIAMFTGTQLPASIGMFGKFRKVIGWLGRGMLWLGRIFLMNPIGLAVTGIATSAFLIYKYWEPIKGFFSDVWKKVTGAFDSGMDRIEATFAKLMNLKDQFVNFGSMMIQGMISGIKSKLTSLKSTVAEIGSSAVTTIKEKLGIKSPSRVFADQVGKQIPAGMAMGIERNQHTLHEATRKLLAPALLAGGLAVPSAYAAASPAAAGGAGAVVHVNAPVTIHIESGGMSDQQLDALIDRKLRDAGQQIGNGIRSTLYDEV